MRKKIRNVLTPSIYKIQTPFPDPPTGEIPLNTNQLHRIILDRFDHSKEIPSSSVPFNEEVRNMCEQNMCGNYGKSWTCPPAVASLDQLHLQLSSYNRFMIVDKVYTLEDSFDWEGMVSSMKDF